VWRPRWSTVERARINELRLLTATTLWENRPARALLRRLDFRSRGGYGAELNLEPALDSAAAGCAS
jgi:hypothetical protein